MSQSCDLGLKGGRAYFGSQFGGTVHHGGEGKVAGT